MSTNDLSSLCVSAENWASSEAKVDKATFLWTIHNFSFLEPNGNINSPSFSAATNDAAIWHVMLKPNGEDDIRDKLSLFLYLNSESKVKSAVFANFSFSIFNGDRKKGISKKSPAVRKFVSDGSTSNSWGWSTFCKKDENFRELLSNDVLEIFCEVIFFQERNVVERHLRCNTFSLESTTPDRDVTENLTTLLNSQFLADVVILVNGKKYPAHKAILAARSTVFAAMFQHDMKENQLNQIEIVDMSEESVEAMLRFIYTGRCREIGELVEELLTAADKYNLDRLKIICSEALFKTLSVENASNIFMLADTYNSKELKTGAIEFIVSRASEVLSTVGWKNLLQNRELIDEVFQAMARRLASQPLVNLIDQK